MRQPIHYPIGSISSGTMRPEDLIPTFCSELESLAKRPGIVSAKGRKAHLNLVREIKTRIEQSDVLHTNPEGFDGPLSEEDTYYESDDCHYDLESLFDALEEYSGPYFYFGAHPGDGADYGWWLSEMWDEDFNETLEEVENGMSLKVSDLADVPKWFRGEVAVVSDHGNVTLYVKTSRGMREIWSVV